MFRITKTVHNILQGVSREDEWISLEEKKVLTDWIEDNAHRYWLSPGGPLRPPSEGGADVIMVSVSYSKCVAWTEKLDRRSSNARIDPPYQEAYSRKTSLISKSYPDSERLGHEGRHAAGRYLAIFMEQYPACRHVHQSSNSIICS